MTFKKKLKKWAEDYNIPADQVAEMQGLVTTMFDEQLAPVQAELQSFKDKEDERTLGEFGTLDEKQTKTLKALIKANRAKDESYKDAMERIAKEFSIEPEKQADNKNDKNTADVTIDDAKPPKKKEQSLFGSEEEEAIEPPKAFNAEDLFN